jgi:hypothetical protein
MQANIVRLVAGAVLAILLAAQAAVAQVATPPPATQTAPTPAPAQLDQLLAPIALYPDVLLAQVLMAATYPLEVVQADRWLQDSQNAVLKGEQLAAALAAQPWDPSVKSLVPFPRILRMMDMDLEWTERLGDAFLADQTAVMDSVQRLRQRAAAAGKLRSTPQQVVTIQGPTITIAPPSPDTVFVPVYDPMLAYGQWPYPNYPPFYFAGFFGGFPVDPYGFGWWGVPIVAPLWGWHHWDWGRHRLDIDRDRFAVLDHGRPPVGDGIWQHDPMHRRGVPYRDAATRARFGGADDMRRGFRGYPAGAAAQNHQAAPAARLPRVARPAAAPPVFESFGRGADVRTQAARGFASRASMPAFVPHGAAARSAPASGGMWHR